MDEPLVVLSALQRSSGSVTVTDADGRVRNLRRSEYDYLTAAIRRALDRIDAGSAGTGAVDTADGEAGRREQKVIAELSRRAVRDELDEVFSYAVDAALTIVDTRCASIFGPVDGSDTLSVAAYSGPQPAPSPVPTGTASGPGYALRSGHAVICIDADGEERFATTSMRARRLRSGVYVPISSETGHWGVLTVHSTEPRVFTAQEVSFLVTVCDILSAAIRRTELEQRLRHQSMHDPLTGLPNRELVHQHLGLALAHTESTGSRIAVLLVDFDNFKSINDHFGHDIGDMALIAVARRLRQAIGPEDSVFRLGGDEFLIVQSGITDSDHAEATARAVGDALRTPLTLERREVPIGASIGIALSENGVGLRQLVHRADVAMYRAKSQLSGAYAVYDADDDRQARHHLTMSTDLRTAIENDELTLRYSPVVDTATSRVTSFAATPRWEHHALGTLDAEEFVATAERTGLIDALGSWILDTACRDASRWLASDPHVAVRVEVAPTQIRQGRFVESVAAAISSAGIAPHQLVISVPENALDPQDTRVEQALAGVSALGVRLFLDNSSGGHSSIRELTRYPYFEFFLLDDSDVGATFREHSPVVLRAVVGLIHSVGAQVVAGSIDSGEQLAAVAEAGCEQAMGAFFGAALSSEEAAASILATALGRPV